METAVLHKINSVKKRQYRPIPNRRKHIFLRPIDKLGWPFRPGVVVLGSEDGSGEPCEVSVWGALEVLAYSGQQRVLHGSG